MNWQRLDRWSSVAARAIAIAGFLVMVVSFVTPAAREWMAGIVLGSDAFRAFTKDEREHGAELSLPVIGRAGEWGRWTDPRFCPPRGIRLWASATH